MSRPRVVLVIGGHDPSGGAGISADAFSVHAFGCHAASILTAATVQNTNGVLACHPLAPDVIRAQVDALLIDMNIAAVKTGMLVCAEVVMIVRELVAATGAPLVVDPVLAAGGNGMALATTEYATALRDHLLPLATLITPNVAECTALAGPDFNQDSVDQAAEHLLSIGCSAILVTGADVSTSDVVVHRLHQPRSATRFEYPRLVGDFHGSGCTLASAISANLANGRNLAAAVTAGLDYAWDAVAAAYPIGSGQRIPQRRRPS